MEEAALIHFFLLVYGNTSFARQPFILKFFIIIIIIICLTIVLLYYFWSRSIAHYHGSIIFIYL